MEIMNIQGHCQCSLYPLNVILSAICINFIMGAPLATDRVEALRMSTKTDNHTVDTIINIQLGVHGVAQPLEEHGSAYTDRKQHKNIQRQYTESTKKMDSVNWRQRPTGRRSNADIETDKHQIQPETGYIVASLNNPDLHMDYPDGDDTMDIDYILTAHSALAEGTFGSSPDATSERGFAARTGRGLGKGGSTFTESAPSPDRAEFAPGSLPADVQSDMAASSFRRPKFRHQSSRRVKMSCAPTPLPTLRGMLGPAFNARYMSIEKPDALQIPDFTAPQSGWRSDDANVGHRQTTEPEPFAVGKDFRLDLHHEPTYLDYALGVVKAGGFSPSQHSSIHGSSRRNRRAKGSLDTADDIDDKQPWQCAQEMVWQDLGTDHFPRFLRSVRCTQSLCWFGHFRCTERSFTVKVLRRSSDECVPVYSAGDSQPGGAPSRYKQDWTFEERAVPFCCECAKRNIF